MFAANIWAEYRDYTIVKGRVTYRDSDGSLQRAWAQCDRYSKPRYSKDPTDQRKRPNRGSRKRECKIEASIIKTYRGGGIWQFKAVEKVNDDVPFELVNDVDYGGNEVIESPVRPRRSGRKRQATRRSLNYHKEMRKGR
jgi:hypothetical protein